MSDKPHVLVTRAVFPETLEKLAQHFEVEANQEVERRTDPPAAGQAGCLHHRQREDRRGGARRLPGPEDLRQHGRWLQQLRRRRDGAPRRDGHQCARRADRDHRGLRLRAVDGDRASHHRERAFPAPRRMEEVALRHVRRCRRARQHAGHPGHGPHRAGHRAARRAGLWHGRDLSQPFAARRIDRVRIEGDLRQQGRPAQARRPPGAGAAVFARVAPRHRRGRAQADEADRHAGEPGARRHRRRRGPGRSAAQQDHRRGRPGCVRGRAHGEPRAAHRAERGADAAHRERDHADAPRHGRPGGRRSRSSAARAR